MRYLSCGMHLYYRTLAGSAGGFAETLDRACVLFGENFADAGERVDFLGSFVRAQAHDARKTERVAAVVTVGTLDIVEGDFQNDVGLDAAAVTEIFHGMREEVAREFLDLDVCQARISFADVDEAMIVANREGVVG